VNPGALCRRCGARPAALVGARYCFACWPGGPVTPPPCLRCGAREAYWRAGLCEACHPSRPRRPEACRDCLAWGVLRFRSRVCTACEWWRGRYPVGACPACRRVAPLHPDDGCRLCYAQRRWLGVRAGAARGGQQLLFAGMFGPPTTKAGARPAPAPAWAPPLRPVGHRQLVLLDAPVDMAAGLRGGFPPPKDPALAAALWAAVRDHAVRHGWSRSGTEGVQRGVRILLGLQATAGAPIRTSDVALLSRIGISAKGVAAALAAAGMLEDDAVPAVERWFPLHIAGLPAPMRAELAVWFDVRRHGSRVAPRARPRADHTVVSQLRFAMPALHRWAGAHTSLREIARADVLAVLPPAGRPRASMLQGLRSVFRVLKARRLTFVDPTAHLSVPKPHPPAPAPVDLSALRAVLDGPDRTAAALAALLAFHGVRIWQLRRARLTDVRDGRLHVGEQVILLAPSVRARLDAYLAERAARWPDTANPHLFVHHRSVGTTGAVTPWWIRKRLGMSGQAIRQDRILDEAHATAGDLRRLCDLFGFSVAGAARYAATVLGPADEAR
jgi:integrase